MDARTNLTNAAKQQIVYIVKHIGFKDALNGPLTSPSLELCVVQDADMQAPPFMSACSDSSVAAQRWVDGFLSI
eukprot:jgi/Tetstr1/442764/TSEL_030851.t1